ncbi:cation:dicarboxylase symporter family transporter [Phenylobacterium sp.]|uniref:dicarboxylate/amino acid:cation symporter n=1 Tax=Phenylobacterium sp. TaxID=1871053 RepID=UPI0025FAD109|nr:cation:dicarboxylase symporter family transporter [Phenylobacterium sp.]MBX3485402.1 dicarboxylate/amino acid:cation symporter [Phenylobacterium sp.]MCW5758389.1 dicarboxylate/amino acid:cation symporter [Phenylobacterium sp.]
MKFLKSLSVQVLIALAAGLVVGAAAAAYGGPDATRAIESVEALGGLWLNALRMTVVPLIFAVLVTGIAQVSDAAATGRLAVRAVLWFTGLLVLSAVTSILVTNGVLALWPVSEAASAALRAGAQAPPAGAPTAPDFAAWVRSLAPSNPIKAASEDAVLPVVVFAVFTGFALTRLPDGRGRALIDVFQALGEAMIVVVRWVLAVAPVGVFALGLGVGLRAGVGAAGVLGQYIVTAAFAGLVITVIGYGLAITVGRVPLGRWARATAPVLATAFATQSSLACLPAMIERSRDDLGIPPRIAGLVLPLAVAIFRFTSPAVNLAVCVFVAKVYGIEPTALQYAGAVLVALAVAVGSVGLPGQVSFIVSVAPICLALGLPIDLLPILLAVEVAPDIFRTLGNVTGDMAVTAIVARGEPASPVAMGEVDGA